MKNRMAAGNCILSQFLALIYTQNQIVNAADCERSTFFFKSIKLPVCKNLKVNQLVQSIINQTR
jgi:hypothetical protein